MTDNQNVDNNNDDEDSTTAIVPPLAVLNAAPTESENVYVRELRRIFDSCATRSRDDGVHVRREKGGSIDDEEYDDDTLKLDQNGLEKLCDELNLKSHRDYIVGQLIPSQNGRLNFDAFKVKFIHLLPEIVEFSTSIDEGYIIGSTPTKKGKISRHGSHLEELMDNEDCGVLHSDNDTSNDVLSDFSDDDGRGVAKINKERRQKIKNFVGGERISNERRTFTQEASDTSSPTRIEEFVDQPLIKKQGTPKSRRHRERMNIDADEVENILSELGLADRGYIGRYELRILCQQLGLNGITPQELNVLFNQLDKDGDGKISVNDFLTVYPNPVTTSDLVAPENVLATTVVVSSTPPPQSKVGAVMNNHKNQQTRNNGRFFPSSDFIIFTSLDRAKTGHVKVGDLLNYWSNIGVEDGNEVLNKVGIVENHWVNVKLLCQRLFLQLDDHIDDDMLVSAAVLSLKAEVLFLKEAFEENRDQASFYLRELQQVNQRNSLLVEELDQSQQNLEMRSQLHLKEQEDKHQSRVSALEAKYRNEREQFHNELRDRDELLHRMQQNEASLQARIRHVERENFKLKTEVDDLTQTVKELEDINRETRSALQDATSNPKKGGRSKNSPNGISTTMYNKSTRNRSSINEFGRRSTINVRSLNGPIMAPVVFKRPVRRKLLPNETSDFESDPEPFFHRMKSKRPLKKKQRLALVAHRMPCERVVSMHDEDSASTSSSSSECIFYETERQATRPTTVNGCCATISTQLSSLEKQLSEERKFLAHELRMEVSTLEEEHTREKQRLVEKFELEKRTMTHDFKRQFDTLAQKHAKEKQTILDELEVDLRRKFEEEKRDLEIRWASERNVAERRFAEEKMDIMERLQNEFEKELKRVKANKVSPNSSQSDMSMSHSVGDKQRFDKVSSEKAQLEITVNSLINDIQALRTTLAEELTSKNDLQRSLDSLKAESERQHSETMESYENANANLKSEIRRLNEDAQRLLNEIDELKKNVEIEKASFVLNTPPTLISIGIQADQSIGCEQCSMYKCQIDQIKNERKLSTLADNDRMAELEVENQDLHERLNSAKEHILELQTCLSVSDSQRLRTAIAERVPLEWTSSTESACDGEAGIEPQTSNLPLQQSSSFCEKLKEENFLLNARLTEQSRLTEELAAQLHDQMKETSKVALVAQNFYSKFRQLEGKPQAESRSSLNDVKEAMKDLYVHVDRLLR